jgi:hypothetical protein
MSAKSHSSKPALVVVTIAGWLLLAPVGIASDVAQAGPNPIVFDQTATTDNLVMLTAGGAEHNSQLSAYNAGSPKYMWIQNFGVDGTSDYLKWTVSLATAATYHVWALTSTNTATSYKLSDGNGSLAFTTRNIGWDKVDCGTIPLPSGTSVLSLVQTSTSTNSNCIKSIELMRESDNAAYQARIAAFKANSSWMANAKYGLMFQYGAWGFPETGSTRKSIEQGAATFDIANFVNLVKSTGAAYVIWSITWDRYWMEAPIQSVDSIMGNTSLTSTTDLIGPLAAALKAQGIRFMLYYHQGIQQEPAWKAQQSFPSSFTLTGTGDRSRFFDNWCAVITEIGKRYGTNLDGWFFDDGCVYYPAPFERLAAAARTGNPSRLISYNPWVSARVTDFQDVYFGESGHGEAMFGSAPSGSNGIFTDGPQKGLLQHANFEMEQDWGVHLANQPITAQITSSQAQSWAQSAIPRKVPLSYDMMMWEDGTVGPTSLGIMETLDKAVGGGVKTTEIAGKVAIFPSWSVKPVVGGVEIDAPLAADHLALDLFTLDGRRLASLYQGSLPQGATFISLEGRMPTGFGDKCVLAVLRAQGGVRISELLPAMGAAR